MKGEKQPGSEAEPGKNFPSNNGWAGILEQKGDDQAQENPYEACHHPEASSAQQFPRDKQPANGQNGGQDRQGSRNDTEHI